MVCSRAERPWSGAVTPDSLTPVDDQQAAVARCHPSGRGVTVPADERGTNIPPSDRGSIRRRRVTMPGPTGGNEPEPRGPLMGGIDSYRAERAAAWLRAIAVPWAGWQLYASWGVITPFVRTTTLTVLVVLAIGVIVAGLALRQPHDAPWWGRFSRGLAAMDVLALIVLATTYAPHLPDVWAVALLAPFVAALRCGTRGAISAGITTAVAVGVADHYAGAALATLTFQTGLVVVVTVLAGLLTQAVDTEHRRLSASEAW